MVLFSKILDKILDNLINNIVCRTSKMEKTIASRRNNLRNLMSEKICQFKKNLKVEKLIYTN